MAVRPYFNKSIADLEALHEAAPEDQRLGNELLNELRHRTTSRALALVDRLERSIRPLKNFHVGFPLLVHRRCQEPMFGISNRIAYDGQMVQAVAHSGPGAIEQSIGGSVWLDIDGNATSKWCAVEGEVVVRLLSQLASSGLRQPDVYIITPFRIVAQEMRRRLESESRLFETFEVDAEEWIKNRVGTIHTFQGKEAEAVIAVLGAPMAAQQGARRWASSTPNILNVMVSRAKQNLYVVGSRAAWGSIGHCRTLASTLPIRKA